jgi:hypothetical protein
MTLRATRAMAVVGAVLVMALGGCLERTMKVTSEPAGALVTINGVEAGRTPLEAGFTHFGTYDVQVRQEGYEPVSGGGRVAAPIYETVPFDFFATVAPVRLHTTRELHYVLQPQAAEWDDAQRAGLLERARALQERAGGASAAP